MDAQLIVRVHPDPNKSFFMIWRNAMIPDVVIYVDPTCPHCRTLKEFLQQKRVPFYEHDVTRDLHAQQYLEEHGFEGIPVARVGDEHVVGYDEQRLNDLIRSSEVEAPA